MPIKRTTCRRSYRKPTPDPRYLAWVEVRSLEIELDYIKRKLSAAKAKLESECDKQSFVRRVSKQTSDLVRNYKQFRQLVKP